MITTKCKGHGGLAEKRILREARENWQNNEKRNDGISALGVHDGKCIPVSRVGR